MSRVAWFIIGVIVGVVVIVPLGVYLFAKFGGMPMATTANPLPLEKTLAKIALRASQGNAAEDQNPLPPAEENMTAGARVYAENCAMCHGLPGQPKSRIAAGEFPPPPQLFEPREMVTRDPQGVTHWRIAHGIRLSGMPGFGDTLTPTEQWQVTGLLAHADNVPPAASKELVNCSMMKAQCAESSPPF
jgi:thiosulfate dehydrogenase